MFTGDQITSDGLSGWPIMHPIERLCNASGVTCMPNGTTLRPDDIAALNRLYPVTATNISTFPGKRLTGPNTLSVTGTITFRNGQGMQGVNVVLRPMIPGTDLLARFGGDDTTLEGYFDLSGVPIPPGETSDTWQLSFEPINPLYTGQDSVGPYATGQ